MTQTAHDLDCLSAAYIESLLEEYLRDPARVPENWRGYFAELAEGVKRASGEGNGSALYGAGMGEKTRFRPSFGPSTLFNPPIAIATTTTEGRPRLPGGGAASSANGNGSTHAQPANPGSSGNGPIGWGDLQAIRVQEKVDQLVRAYRVRGHLSAHIDPLGTVRQDHTELSLAFHGLNDADLGRSISTTSIGGPSTQTLGAIIKRMKKTYCDKIAAQFMHIDDLAVRDWLLHRMETTENHIKLSRAEQIRIYTRLVDASIFEEFVRRKHIGAKTFSLEGAESLIPLLDMAIEKVGSQGVDKVVMGMAHRGRLNVLSNILGKRPQEIFWEFKDATPNLYRGGGDVKYHLGYNSEWTTAQGKQIHLSLCFNPSHLEYVNTVAMGRLRSKQDRTGDSNREKGLTLLIHGDAAFAGEGIVQETLNLSQLPGYEVGGTLHVIVNNQVGFTTMPEEARSTTYATDVAKMLQIPIFHVNGEDPAAVAQVVNLALDFRQHWKRDVVIDMYCYRRWGHNEGDEPGYTQPQMYKLIENRDSVRVHYLEHLLLLGEITVDEADRIVEERRKQLESEFATAHSQDFKPTAKVSTGKWRNYLGGPEPLDDEPNTGAPVDQLASLLEKLNDVPAGFTIHPKLKRTFEKRSEMARGESALDWAAGEALAFATLVQGGSRVRITGQDSERGTFSHRHSVLRDYQTGVRHCPLEHLSPNQAVFEVRNSPLSESGVLGFEYGYSLDSPDALVVWEAQFGDFWNVAQVLVDQFIASAEDKWRNLSGLVMLLPHGFEGQGPEHSSARLERFLQLCAEDNMQVVCPTTPAQIFHLLRRQVLRKWRKPLVVMTPKSLLRHPRVVSPLDALVEGRFQRVLRDERPGVNLPTRRVLLCTGKVYYDLVEQREKHKIDDVAIVRIEQLYPLPQVQLRQVMDEYPAGTPVYWVQEEPENMGAWHYLRVIFGESLFQSYPFAGISRSASASPATGSHEAHKLEQQEILAQALTGQ